MPTALTSQDFGKFRDWFLRELTGPDERLFAVLDAAREPRIPANLKAFGVEFVSLYRGEPEEALAEVAPYLVKVDGNTHLMEWLLSGWGQSWGIFANSSAEIEDVRRHLRRFLIVQDPNGKDLYFRFYDPRVLRVYLPTCTVFETKQFLGPINAYLMESETGKSVLRYSRDGLGNFVLSDSGIQVAAANG
jgi:hypothetical protein